ncbi:hypothetical protein ATK36_4128 [Amycolatopsis sulphurea]|uniref:Uncharacterized protein n=1 Tax=Amycolatopsis sulphurea TaxID=76022 RepID=A0A2A9FF08_9PSEU|nr:hypothetical protein [Amycolatopsis sulphurea]PFG49009.1 hypothetical protein ATK36_4128 [Amycolatopsis sulphurea]
MSVPLSGGDSAVATAERVTDLFVCDERLRDVSLRTEDPAHPDMVVEPAGSTSGNPLGELFRRLLCTDPLITFAEPLLTTLPTGDRA